MTFLMAPEKRQMKPSQQIAQMPSVYPHCRAKGCVGVLKVSSTTWGGFISVGGKKETLRMVQESVSAQGDKSQVDGVCVLHARW